MAQVAGRWALVRARTGESAGTVQTLAGSTGDFVPFSCRALCLTRLMGKGEPSCFLLLPLHCGSLCERLLVLKLSSQTLSLEDHSSGKTSNSEDTPVFLALVKTHMSRHVVVAPILAAPLLTDGQQWGQVRVRTLTQFRLVTFGVPGEYVAFQVVLAGLLNVDSVDVQASVVSPATSSFTPFNITFLVLGDESLSHVLAGKLVCAVANRIDSEDVRQTLPVTTQSYALVVLWRARQIRWWNVSR